MNRDRHTYMIMGSITTGLGMAISLTGNVIEPQHIGTIGLAIGFIFMFRGVTWLFWGGD